MLLVVLPGLAAGLLANQFTMGCPVGFANDELPGVCTIKTLAESGWYTAEGACRDMGGHLPTIDSKELLSGLMDGVDSMLVGLNSASGKWRWADGSLTNKAETGGFLPDIESPDFRCAAAVRDSTTGTLSIVNTHCDTAHKYLCAVGINDCVWQGRDLVYSGGSLRGMVTVLSRKVLLLQGKEIGIGGWITPNTFSVPDVAVNGVPCTYLVTFKANSVADGCQGTEKGVIVHPVRAVYKQTPDCTESGINSDSSVIVPTNPPDKGLSEGSDEKKDVTDGPGRKPGPVGNAPGYGAESTVVEESIPEWLWPAAIVTAVVVSAVAAVGAANRRGRRRKGSGNSGSTLSGSGSSGEQVMMSKIGGDMSSPEGGGGGEVPLEHVHVPPHAACVPPEKPCDACQKFSQTRARQRLLNVYRSLASELTLPLVIRNITCVHQEKEHIHLFEVENEFSSHTLQSLSTLYSRTKPRPRATRIHIEPKSKPMETDFGEEQYM